MHDLFKSYAAYVCNGLAGMQLICIYKQSDCNDNVRQYNAVWRAECVFNFLKATLIAGRTFATNVARRGATYVPTWPPV